MASPSDERWQNLGHDADVASAAAVQSPPAMIGIGDAPSSDDAPLHASASVEVPACLLPSGGLDMVEDSAPPMPASQIAAMYEGMEDGTFAAVSASASLDNAPPLVMVSLYRLSQGGE